MKKHHHTSSILAVAVVAMVGCATQAPSVDNRVQLWVNEPSPQGGKPLVGAFAEVERAPDYSIVVATYTSGAALPYSLFVLKGMCAVMRSRGESFSISKELESRPSKYRVTFPKSATPEQLSGAKKEVFSLSDCKLLGN